MIQKKLELSKTFLFVLLVFCVLRIWAIFHTSTQAYAVIKKLQQEGSCWCPEKTTKLELLCGGKYSKHKMVAKFASNLLQ